MAVALKSSNPAPAYRQITELIMANVDSGKLGPGTKIDTEIALAEKLGLSRMTVNKAYHELPQRGHIERVRSRGAFVRQRYAGNRTKGTLTLLAAGIGLDVPADLSGAGKETK